LFTNYRFTNLILRYILYISPIFFLTIKHWTNAVVIIFFICGIFDFIKNNNKYRILLNNKNKYIYLLVVFMFVTPLLSVIISQILRNDYYLPNYDGPLRIAMCSFIFLLILLDRLNTSNSGLSISQFWVQYAFPLVLLWTFIYRPSWTSNWGDRVTTYFIDPLSFGSFISLFTIITIFSLSFYWVTLNYTKKLFLIVCLIIGFYLIIKCGSRTGLLSFPVAIIIWFYFIGKKYFTFTKSLIIVFLLFLLLVIIFSSNSNILYKIMLIKKEILEYQWNEVNLDNSIAMRINFIRMALYYISESPISGWGDTGWIILINNAEFSKYVSEFGQLYSKNGFHNEILTNTVRSGVFGLLSTLCILFIPIYMSFKMLYKDNNKKNIINYHALCLLIIMLHYLLTSLSTEVTNLIVLSSFFGITIAIFLGELLLLDKNYFEDSSINIKK